MSDDVTLNPGTGGDVIAADEIGNRKFQRVKLIHGADGINAGDVSEANPYPVICHDNRHNITNGTDSHLSVVHKFGRNPSVGTSFVPVAFGGFFRTPQVSGATALRVKAGNTNDSPSGTGARKVILQGLDETGALVEEEIPTNGTSAGAASNTTFLRLFRAYVSETGTYATQAAGSHAASIVIENAAGTENWATIDATDFPRGQSEIGVYTIPLGYTGYIENVQISGDSTKNTNVIFFQRRNILETSAPYSAIRKVFIVFQSGGNQTSFQKFAPFGPYPELTDIGFLAKVSAQTAQVNVNFEILLEAN